VKNTRFEYLYRDASNYKQHGAVVLKGAITEELRKRFVAALDEELYFIADQINIPEVFITFGEDSKDDDHCWHEFSEFELTDAHGDDGRTVEQFVEAVEAASKHGWKTFEQQTGQRI
jgi:hypothetical protein